MRNCLRYDAPWFLPARARARCATKDNDSMLTLDFPAEPYWLALP